MVQSPSDAMSPSASSSIPPVANIAARPSLCMKPAISPTPFPTNANSPVASLTSREWVVPPRPKPGRKPATDTPPTKRKAQNRAAQRAFRERRAARVGELEEQMKVVEEENEHEKGDLKLTISRLEKEVEQYRAQVVSWAERYRQLEREFADSKSQQVHKIETQPVGAPAAPNTTNNMIDENEEISCGRCTLHSQCQCIDDAFAAMSGEHMGDDGASHDRPTNLARQRAESTNIKVESSDDMEIDFTGMYSQSQNRVPRSEVISPASGVHDPCGFCQDGTPCICAEMAADQQNRASLAIGGNRQILQFTPPPSEGDVVQSLSISNACASGPGTCAQCRADPNSTLFCKSLAASRAQAGASSGCCGGKGRDRGCCQDSVPLLTRATRSRAAANRAVLPPAQVPKPPVVLSCADAFTALSRHPAYERASRDLANWMPKLCANPSNLEGRPAMEIDAANVMAVLRDFDRRFGSDR